MRVIAVSTLRVVYGLNRLMHMKYLDAGYMQVLRIASGARLVLDRCWLLSLKARVKFQQFLAFTCVVLSAWKAPSLLLKASTDLPLKAQLRYHRRREPSRLPPFPQWVRPSGFPQLPSTLSVLGQPAAHHTVTVSCSVILRMFPPLDREPLEGRVVSVWLCAPVLVRNMWECWMDPAGRAFLRAVSPLPAGCCLLSWRSRYNHHTIPKPEGWSPLTMPLSSSTLVNGGDNHLPDRGVHATFQGQV